MGIVPHSTIPPIFVRQKGTLGHVAKFHSDRPANADVHKTRRQAGRKACRQEADTKTVRQIKIRFFMDWMSSSKK